MLVPIGAWFFFFSFLFLRYFLFCSVVARLVRVLHVQSAYLCGSHTRSPSSSLPPCRRDLAPAPLLRGQREHIVGRRYTHVCRVRQWQPFSHEPAFFPSWFFLRRWGAWWRPTAQTPRTRSTRRASSRGTCCSTECKSWGGLWTRDAAAGAVAVSAVARGVEEASIDRSLSASLAQRFLPVVLLSVVEARAQYLLRSVVKRRAVFTESRVSCLVSLSVDIVPASRAALPLGGKGKGNFCRIVSMKAPT